MSPKDRLLLLDFDHTLFDTARFFRDVLEYVQREHGLDPQSMKAHADQQTQTGGVYDFFRHVETAAGPGALNREALRDEMARNHYLFDEVPAFLFHFREIAEIVILTVGMPEFQSFKISLCAELAGIPVRAVPEHKGPYLARQLVLDEASGLLGVGEVHPGKYRQVDMIEDRPESFDSLPAYPNLKLWRVKRPGSKYEDRPTLPPAHEITSLRGVG